MTTASSAFDPIAASAASIRAALGAREVPRVAVLLGSGWGGFADTLSDPIDLPYAALPAFPEAGVGGHRGGLRLARLESHAVAVLRGRRHAYETGDAAAMAGAVRTLAALGVRALVQTNAAGSLRADLPPGAVMLLADHLNLPQRSPLVGWPHDDRFVAMSDAYCPRLRAAAQEAAAAAGHGRLAEGVYAWVLGPQFETPAEIRMLRTLGADAVGMSTVPETILARHAGLRVLALSLFTNMAAGLSAEALSHAHTLATAEGAAPHAVALLRGVVGAVAAAVNAGE